jgi:predicted ATP-binding protein involved in virulence
MQYIQSAHLQDFRYFRNATIPFIDKLTVFVGKEGKTSALHAVRVCAQMMSSPLTVIPISSLRKDADCSFMSFRIFDKIKNEGYVELPIKLKKKNNFENLSLEAGDSVASYVSELHKKEDQLPFAYFPAKRNNYIEFDKEIEDTGDTSLSKMLKKTLAVHGETTISDSKLAKTYMVLSLAKSLASPRSIEDDSVFLKQGVALIDEVEQHLHPEDQQTLLPQLLNMFPNVQFIVTTQSPLVVSSISSKHVVVLKDGDAYNPSIETEGADVSRVLQDVFGVDPRPQENEYVKYLKEYSTLVYASKWDTERARDLRDILVDHFGSSDPIMTELQCRIDNEVWEMGI